MLVQAPAGIHFEVYLYDRNQWIPAFAGMTDKIVAGDAFWLRLVLVRAANGENCNKTPSKSKTKKDTTSLV
jgi:hypothetical protein